MPLGVTTHNLIRDRLALMSKAAYSITVVLDRSYGDRLSDLPLGQPVWIVDTPVNRAAAQKLWSERHDETHLTGITTFKSDLSAEESLIDEFDTIDLHHGSYSADPPYTVVDVIGARLTDSVRATLQDFGFDEFRLTSAGFRAIRPLPDDKNHE